MLVRQGPSIAVVDDDIPGQHKHLLSRFMVSVGFYPIHLLYFSLLPILFSVPLAIMHIPFIDALFLGTSAVCSNGLTTYTFPNRAAEVILFFAIQCGGVCFVSLFSVLLRLAFIRANFCQVRRHPVAITKLVGRLWTSSLFELCRKHLRAWRFLVSHIVPPLRCL